MSPIWKGWQLTHRFHARTHIKTMLCSTHESIRHFRNVILYMRQRWKIDAIHDLNWNWKRIESNWPKWMFYHQKLVFDKFCLNLYLIFFLFLFCFLTLSLAHRCRQFIFLSNEKWGKSPPFYGGIRFSNFSHLFSRSNAPIYWQFFFQRNEKQTCEITNISVCGPLFQYCAPAKNYLYFYQFKILNAWTVLGHISSYVAFSWRKRWLITGSHSYKTARIKTPLQINDEQINCIRALSQTHVTYRKSSRQLFFRSFVSANACSLRMFGQQLLLKCKSKTKPTKTYIS